jgi:hypothetical protein
LQNFETAHTSTADKLLLSGPMANYPRTAGRYGDNAFAVNKRGKLERLQTHLKTISPLSREVTLTFAQVERILGGPLPAFAKSQSSWWENQPQADVWLAAGFHVDLVHLKVHHAFVRFRRSQHPSAQA